MVDMANPPRSAIDQRQSGERYYDEADADRGISFADLYQRFVWIAGAAYRSRWIVLSILVAALVLGAVGTLLMTPLYTASATIQIDQQTERVLGTEDQAEGASFQDSERFLQTNLQVLKSRATAVRVAQSLNLFAGTDFIQMMGAKLRVPAGANSEQLRREAVLDLLDKNLSVDLPRNSRVASITFKSPDPKLSSRIANAFAENFITGNLQRKFNSTSYARTFLQKQLVPARERLEASERQLVVYARQAGLIGTQQGSNEKGEGQPNSVTVSSLVALNSAYAGATANRIAAEQRWRVAQKTPVGALPESYSNQAIQELYQTRAAKTAELQDELKRHKADYPTVIQAKAVIAELDRQLNAMNGAIRRSIVDQYDTARQQEQALAAAVEDMKKATLEEQSQSIQYNILRRDVDSNRSMYEALLQRFKEVSAASGIAANNISIIDRADPPLKPTSPRLGINLVIALLLGLVVAAAAIIIRELFDDRVQTGSDAERKFGLPTLGVIPQFKNGGAIDLELESPRSATSEAYHSAAIAVLLSSARKVPHVIMLTSAQPGEGKSSSTIGLANALARLNKRTLLVECDLRRPSLRKRLAEIQTRAPVPGLTEYLTQQIEQPPITTHSKLRFDYMLAGSIPPNPTDLLGSGAFAAMLHDLTSRYDHIVIDGPPILGLADAPLLASRSDVVLFVVEANRSHRGRAKAALNRIRRFDTPVSGTILTKVDINNRMGMGYDLEYYSY